MRIQLIVSSHLVVIKSVVSIVVKTWPHARFVTLTASSFAFSSHKWIKVMTKKKL